MRYFIPMLCLLALPLTANAEEVIRETKTASITCTTTPTQLKTSISTRKDRYLAVNVPSSAAVQVFIGDSTVTSANGLDVPPGKTYSTNKKVSKGLILYCVTASGSVTVRVQETVTGAGVIND